MYEIFASLGEGKQPETYRHAAQYLYSASTTLKHGSLAGGKMSWLRSRRAAIKHKVRTLLKVF